MLTKNRLPLLITSAIFVTNVICEILTCAFDIKLRHEIPVWMEFFLLYMRFVAYHALFKHKNVRIEAAGRSQFPVLHLRACDVKI
jgi:hypothetical protein